MIAPVQDAQDFLQVDTFRKRYGEAAMRLAYHGAFPLTLTTNLLYCIRENFVPEVPWYAVGDVLLSGLCRQVGHDLYEMTAATRRGLLEGLKDDLGDQAQARVERLEQFMLAYVQQRLVTEKHYIQRMIGDKQVFRWTALAPFRPEQELVEVIRRDLANLAARDDSEERFWLARLVKSQADWLTDSGYRVLLLDWTEQIAATGTIEPSVEAAAKTLAIGLPVKPLDFEVVMLRPAGATDELQPFDFQVVTVNARGEELTRQTQQAFKFLEPLGETTLPLEMVAIPGGQFLMGAPKGEKDAMKAERPQHQVTITPFFMGRTPVIHAQWRFVAGLPQVSQKLNTELARFKSNNLPIEQVSWDDAMEFCARLSNYTQRDYRLPTEAEWEYACRADTTTPFHFGATITSNLANYYGSEVYQQEPKGEYRNKTTPIDHFGIANAFGLSDMHGNVWEWCLDHWHSNYKGAPTDGSAWGTDDKDAYRVLRGGSWDNFPRSCRSAFRYVNTRVHRNDFIGFRVVCVAPRTLP
ncbi:MAG: formylglycine-generating enzyme family protein [Leptolyngbya sp. SIO1E4]|nr:formylglycine-generating enzyme family protein [Leptolyngbya sp. SIO1E4]